MHLLTQFLRGRWVKRFLLVILGIAVLGILLYLGRSPGSQSGHDRFVDPSLQPLTTIPTTAQQVKTGFYPINVYQLDIANQTYYVDAYVWFKWKGDIDPTENLEFTNAVEEWGFTQQPSYEEPKKHPNGELYQILRIEGRFFQPFNLAKYPLDQQRLGMAIENSIYTLNELVYVADKDESGFDDGLFIQGWNLTGWQAESFSHQYPTTFGDVGTQATAPYSNLRYELLISRPISYFIWKLLLPLVIVLASGWGALLLNPTYVESRIAFPVTALLTIVFLQQAYSYTLPEVGDLVLLDKIYALSYLLIIAAIMETIITADWASSGKPEDIDRVTRLDRPFLAVQFLVLAIGVLLLILL